MKLDILSFCDKNYVTQFVTMMRSIHNNITKNYVLTCLALDQPTYIILKSLQKKYSIRVYSLIEFEDNIDFLILKNNNKSNPINYGDGQSLFHWAISSFWSHLCSNRLCQDDILYVDADIFFYSDPSIIFDKCQNKIGLTTHKHIPKNDDTKVGYYNVGVMYFPYNYIGRKCLKWWKDSTIETNPTLNQWNQSHGSCGDQKYLELFPELFGKENIHIIDEDIGHSAPWNLSISTINNRILTWDTSHVQNQGFLSQNLVFHHFSHFTYNLLQNEFRVDRNGEWGDLHKYPYVIDLYSDYFTECRKSSEEIRSCLQ